jgi:CBS domain-containing protein
MSISALARRDVVSVAEDADLVAAARAMRERHVGMLVVTRPLGAGGEEPIGIVTDRDIVVAVIAREADPRELRVGDVMTPGAITVSQGASIDEALHRMRETGVRRLPVVDGSGRLAGLVSVDDIVDHVAGMLLNVAGAIRNEQRIERTSRP